MSSLHLIRSLRHALAALRDALTTADADRVAATLIVELEDGLDPEIVQLVRRRALFVGAGSPACPAQGEPDDLVEHGMAVYA